MSGRASDKLFGARRARASWHGRLTARAAARDLRAFVVPGPEVARAAGLDLRAAGLGVSPTPRHAGVLVAVGRLPEDLREAAAVAYAQMPRPRAVLAVGVEDVSPLPGPDVSVGLDQGELESGVAELRRLFAGGAFDPEAEAYDAAALRSRTQYTCSMHPEIVQDEPGTCPKCGMDLVPREVAEDGEGGMDHGHMDHGDHGGAGHESMHGGDGETPTAHDGDPDHGSHGEMGHKGRDERSHEGEDHAHHDHARHGAESEQGRSDHDASGADYTEADHPAGGESGGDAALEHAGHEHDPSHDPGGAEHGAGHEDPGDHGGHGGHEDMSHGGMDHSGMDHGDIGFMSMVEMTQGTPRSSDGLQMEWVEAPFGPLFPGLPGGLSLTFTLDGDTVAEAEVASMVGALMHEDLNGPVGAFVERLAGLDPLSPVSYRLLALHAIESATGARVNEDVALARVGGLERERAASHLNWLASFGYLIGYAWLARRAEELQLALLRAGAEGIDGIRSELRKLTRRVERTPLLRRKLAGVGKVVDLDGATGPVARAGGQRTDARLEEETYHSLGFEPIVVEGVDALARLRVRLAEAEQSLGLVEGAGASAIPSSLPETDSASGEGAATVETPRGTAKLAVTLEGGEVTVAEMETPSTGHMGLVEPVTGQRELGDALAGVASLDLSPWEVAR